MTRNSRLCFPTIKVWNHTNSGSPCCGACRTSRRQDCPGNCLPGERPVVLEDAVAGVIYGDVDREESEAAIHAEEAVSLQETNDIAGRIV